ncbi:MAG: CBS domain-containing membrane protein [Halieaceae bacterium]|jgi:CBS domain-containing membrane protein
MLSVAEIMTREPYSLGPDDTLRDAAQLMHEHHIRHVPIVSGDHSVIGLVSHRDVLAASDSQIFHSPRDATGKEGYVALSTVMSSPVHTVEENASLQGAAMHLRNHRLGCLPVVREGRLVGIISDSDFLEVAITLMEHLEMSEPGDPEDMD